MVGWDMIMASDKQQIVLHRVPIRAITVTSWPNLYVVDIGHLKIECRRCAFAKAWKF